MSVTLAERFWAKVEKTDTCWRWTGALLRSGYGVIRVGGRAGSNKFAHRLSYEMHLGPIPEGLDVDHLCRNRACINPDHLEPVTRQVNLLRGKTLAARNASRTHCPRGHEYSPENTRITRQTRSRTCRECDRIKHRVAWKRRTMA